MCQHVRSLGYDNVMIQVGEFLNRRDWYNVNLNDKIHLDFIGIEAFADFYCFNDFILDADRAVEVNTSSITGYNPEQGPLDETISPFELFETRTVGYKIYASIPERIDGCANGQIVVNSRDRRIAKEVHEEVLAALRDLYKSTKEGDNASTKALEHVWKYSKHKDVLRYHQFSS